jgi:hypothetical protein
MVDIVVNDYPHATYPSSLPIGRSRPIELAPERQNMPAMDFHRQ